MKTALLYTLVFFMGVSTAVRAQDKVVVVPLMIKKEAAGTTGQVQYNSNNNLAGADIYYENSTGRVGIGTNSPTSVLELSTTGQYHGLKSTMSYGIPVYAIRNSTTGNWPAVHGQCASQYSESSAVRGVMTVSNSGARSAGVRGINQATDSDGYGVYGIHEGSGKGVSGIARGSSGNASGVYGESTALVGKNFGGYFVSRSYTENSAGVYGQATHTGSGAGRIYGGYFQSDGQRGTGVYGYASHSSTSITYGGEFEANGDNSAGVFAHVDGAHSRGINAISKGANGTGIRSYASGTNSTGVDGSGTAYDFYARGAGVNYAPFTGSHEVKLIAKRAAEIVPGMIVSVTGKVGIRVNDDNSISISSTLPLVTLSSISRDKKVLGVFVNKVELPEDHWYDAEEEDLFGVVNALGEGRVLVTNLNGNIEAGDYITTSAVSGYGQRQEDDTLHSYTLGKAIETPNWQEVEDTIDHNGKLFKVYLIAVVYTSG